MHMSILEVFTEHVPAMVHAVLKRQAGRLDLCNPWAQMCLPSLIQFLPPPQGYKGYPGPAGHPGEQVRAAASAPPCLPSLTPAPACPWPPPWARLHECAPEPGGSASHPAGAPTLPHLSARHICLKGLESMPAWCWHEPLDSS